MAETQIFVGELVLVNCCECGIPFGLESNYKKRRLDDHKYFYCPSGHSQYFAGKSEKQELLERIDELSRVITQKNAYIDTQSQEKMHLNHRLRSAKAAKTKIINRVKNGVCPCCNRTFTNLQRHFKSKHPELLELKK